MDKDGERQEKCKESVYCNSEEFPGKENAKFEKNIKYSR